MNEKWNDDVADGGLATNFVAPLDLKKAKTMSEPVV